MRFFCFDVTVLASSFGNFEVQNLKL